MGLILAESLLAFTIATARREQTVHYLSVSDANTCAAYCGGDEMSEFVRSDFGSARSVRQVEVDRTENSFSIVAHLASFEKGVRRMLYAKQKALYREFPMYSFDLMLVDASDAISG